MDPQIGLNSNFQGQKINAENLEIFVNNFIMNSKISRKSKKPTQLSKLGKEHSLLPRAPKGDFYLEIFNRHFPSSYEIFDGNPMHHIKTEI